MDKAEADNIISGYIKKLYGFAVSKTFSIDEAEELSSQIVLEVYRTLLSRENIMNIDGYIYRIAKNVYAHFVAGRNRFTAVDGIEYLPDSHDMSEQLMKDESVGLLHREITYLSKIRREIIILHYFRDKKISEIARTLEIPENTVKWHLACSRKELKTGMDKIRTTGTLGTQPIKFTEMGHRGHPGEKGDTASFLAKSFTQNVAYAAYHQPRSVNEIAEELGVNPIFVEEETAVLEEYGFMDRQKDGRYLTNIEIHEFCEESSNIYKKIEPEYAKLFAEKFFVPVLENVTRIHEWIHVPDNDINLFKWAMVCFLAHKLSSADISDSKYSVKRPDGGDYVAYAIAGDYGAEPIAGDNSKYWSCGDMWRNTMKQDVWWKSWQLDCYWTSRRGLWMDNLNEDYDKLYYYLNNMLPETISNIESYQRLLDKGYLLKKDGGYKVNIILCDSEEKWFNYIPDAGNEITALSREYAEQATKAALVNQPAHMHEQIKYYNQNAACSLHTRIMEQLLDMGVLTEPDDEQKKGLLTIMFTGR